MSSDIAIKVENLSKCYQIYEKPSDRLKQMIMRGRKQYYREFWALKDVSFEVKKGETLGIIGRNGSGKSTLLQLICETLSPTSGSIETQGRIAALLELGSGFNPDFTGRENVYMNGAVLGLSEDEIKSRFEEIADFADIGDFMEQPVKTYSSGMFVRLAFAVQAHIDASIVVIDEALAVGDVFFRQKCYSRLEQLKKSGAAIILVSHSMPDIEQYCSRAVLLNSGILKFIGSASDASKHYYLLNQSDCSNVDSSETDELQTVDINQITKFEHPDSSDFVDLSNAKQVRTSHVKCLRMALCNELNKSQNIFSQGDKAIFFTVYEVAECIDVPICGIVIMNDRRVIVHGKNSWQYDCDLPVNVSAGSVVMCKHEISLCLAPGEYTFELGFSTIKLSNWAQRKIISHDEWSARYQTLCVVTGAGQFSIGLAKKNDISVLTHHGVADLPGKIFTDVIKL